MNTYKSDGQKKRNAQIIVEEVGHLLGGEFTRQVEERTAQYPDDADLIPTDLINELLSTARPYNSTDRGPVVIPADWTRDSNPIDVTRWADINTDKPWLYDEQWNLRDDI